MLYNKLLKTHNIYYLIPLSIKYLINISKNKLSYIYILYGKRKRVNNIPKKQGSYL